MLVSKKLIRTRVLLGIIVLASIFLSACIDPPKAILGGVSYEVDGCIISWSSSIAPNTDFFGGAYGTSLRLAAYDYETGELLGHYVGKPHAAADRRGIGGEIRIQERPSSGKVEIVVKHDGEELGTVVLDMPNCWPNETLWVLGVSQMDTSIMEASVPADGGGLACGVFDVLTHGTKTVDLSLYPDCEGDLTVLCLTDKGEWYGGDVSNVVQYDDGVLQFDSHQHGTCGLFEQ